MIKKPFTVHRSPFTGYTLIELLVGMTIVSIVFGIGLSGYRDFARRQALTGITKKVVSDLRYIQQKALAGEKPDGCITLSGYQLNRVSVSIYNLEAVCEDAIIIKETNLTENGVNISLSTNPIKFKVLGQGTNLESEAVITLSSPVINRSFEVIIGVGGDIK